MQVDILLVPMSARWAELQAAAVVVEEAGFEDSVRAARVAEAIEVMRRLWRGDASSFAGAHYRLEAPSGFLRADPPPPVVVGGVGPRLATIAGRHGDGFNTLARHPRLAELAATARAARAATGRDPAGFLVTAFANFDERWLDPDSTGRRTLADVGVDRLILQLAPPYDAARLRAAGPRVRAGGRPG